MGYYAYYLAKRPIFEPFPSARFVRDSFQLPHCTILSVYRQVEMATPSEHSPTSDKEASISIYHDENAVAVVVDVDELPKGYYYSLRFLGTFLAVGINLMASTGGFAIIAPVVETINQDIGPGPVVWVSLIYTLMLAVGLTLVGQ